MLKVILKWTALIAPSLFMNVFGKAICWILPFFVQADGWLPSWLSWFSTPDNNADGDAGHWERHPGTDWWSTYKRRTAWFWRNTCYGFDMQILGVQVLETDTITVEGNPDIGDQSGISGKCYRELIRDEEMLAFQWYFVKHYELFGKWHKCVRIGVGWKLWNAKPFLAQYWLYFNPMK
nr:MAG TPA: Envelope protein [Caudoviricetes sp.]